jgi:hypothetical protein
VTLQPKGLLIEEQRSNLLTYSDDWSNAVWSKGGITVLSNVLTAPSGTVTADLLTEDATNAAHASANLVGTADSIKTLSVYAKQGSGTRFLHLYTTNSGAYANFNVTAGTVTASASCNASIQPVGNGWFRCVMTPTDLNNYNFVVSLSNSGSATRAPTYTGDGTSGIYVWGAQLEAGAFATSYIPTVASQVTRAADSASMIGNNFARWYNQTEGTLYSDVVFNSGSVPADQLVFQVDNGSNDQRHKISRYAAVFYGTTRITGSTVVDMSLGTANGNTAYKVDYAYKVNDFAGTSNAGTVATDTSGAVPVPLTTANIGRNGVGGEFLNGTIKRIAYYPRRLANTELTSITS